MNKFFNSLGHIKAKVDDPDIVENTPLFHWVYCRLYGKSYNIDEFFIDGQIDPRFAESHDNFTAFAVELVLKNRLEDLAKIKITRHLMHPRDLIFRGYCLKRKWSYPLLPALLIIFIYMALTKTKTRPRLLDWAKSGFGGGRTVLKSDTEILYYIRLQLPKEYGFMHWTRKIITPLLRRRFGVDWVKGLMDTYYQDPKHPIRQYFVEGQ